MMVTFGNASGAVPPFPPLTLNQKGSLFLTRPSLAHYCTNREELEWRANDVFSWLRDGKFKLHIDRVYKLTAAADAQTDLASRRTKGKLLLEP
jgi:NADPH2:quinone reductase